MHGKVHLLLCFPCNIYVTPLNASDQETQEHYSESYVLTSSSKRSIDMHRYGQYPENVKLVAEIGKYRKAPARMIDIGCHAGHFLDEARRRGYEVFGVELLKQAVSYTQRIGLDVADSLESIEGSFDIATMWHVLEHIPKPAPFLKDLRERLTPGGYLVLRVPDFTCTWSRLLKHRWLWFQPENHVLHFSAESLRKLVENAGFEVLDIEQRRPNNLLTLCAFNLSRLVFARYEKIHSGFLRSVAARLYQDITCREIYILAQRVESP